jgi:hypothetical protein
MPVLARLGHTIARHRLAVIGIWIVLTVLGAYSAVRVSDRWFGGTVGSRLGLRGEPAGA